MGVEGARPFLTRDGKSGRDVARTRLILGPRKTVFDLAVFYSQTKLARRMLCCPNTKCDEPYFLRSKRGQEYCGVDCSRLARLETKRRCWHRHPEYRQKN